MHAVIINCVSFYTLPYTLHLYICPRTTSDSGYLHIDGYNVKGLKGIFRRAEKLKI
jgi:hypothetical protein